jgi:hypothetical protein
MPGKLREYLERFGNPDVAKRVAAYSYGALQPGGVIPTVVSPQVLRAGRAAQQAGGEALRSAMTPPAMQRAVAAGQETVQPKFVPQNEAEAARYGADWLRRNREDAERDAAAREQYMREAADANASLRSEQERYAATPHPTEAVQRFLEHTRRGGTGSVTDFYKPKR